MFLKRKNIQFVFTNAISRFSELNINQIPFLTIEQRNIITKMQILSKESDDINDLLCSGKESSDKIQKSQIRLQKLQKNHEIFKDIWERLKQIQDLELTKKQEKDDKETVEFCDTEIDSIKEEIEELYDDGLNEVVKVLLEENDSITSEIDPNIANLEFRGGVGGSEGSLFAADLLCMYQNYCASQGYRFQIIKSSSDEGNSNSIKQATVKVTGYDCYTNLLCESGTHKVIRVPETEKQGRLHSSTASMIVLPEIPLTFELNEQELKYDFMRASGAGGQHVNKTDSACRITHIPTGIQVYCQDDRSQHNNKVKAREAIKERLFQVELDKHLQKQSEFRSEQFTGGDRSDKIRTYNYPQDRITDHRLGFTLHGIKNMLNGDYVQQFIDEYQDKQRQIQIQSLLQNIGQENKQTL